MSADDRVRWDTIFRQQAHLPYPAPDPLVLQFTPPPAPEARALDLCAGMGQNGLWLAEQGYLADIMDISRVALQRARTEMTIRNLRNVNLLQTDVDLLRLDRQQYDLVCVCRYLRRDLFTRIAASVKPGGRVIYETYNLDYLQQVPNFNRRFLLQPNELAAFFASWTLLHQEEVGGVSQIVAVRPAS